MRTPIRPITAADRAEWIRMRRALWPDETEPGEHEREVDAFFAGSEARPAFAVFVAERPHGGLSGFVEVGMRGFAEGCASRPVPYLEGWYVDPDRRRCGVGRALVRRAEEWAIAGGHTEIASDADPDNAPSLAAHAALGFVEVGRSVCYRRALRG
jgi:aminoglycoside 6'-N-acetyltransferase I